MTVADYNYKSGTTLKMIAVDRQGPSAHRGGMAIISASAASRMGASIPGWIDAPGAEWLRTRGTFQALTSSILAEDLVA